MSASLTVAIKQAARELGFDAVGISRLPTQANPATHRNHQDPEADLLDRLQKWLRRGYHATMAWMVRDPERRADPTRVLPGCRSIISVGMNYYTDYRADERQGNGRIARYAWGRDYHKILGDRLAQLTERIGTLAAGSLNRAYVDTGPVMEKAWAQQAGLGWIGKHSNLVSTDFGSWLLLGEILTTLELEPDEAGSDLCGSCTLCIQACPTGAITEPYVVDAGRCISYLTIELKGSIPPGLRPLIGNRVYGCDDCQIHCPWNRDAPITRETDFAVRHGLDRATLVDLFGWTQQAFESRMAGSAILRIGYERWLRNLAVGLGNAPTSSQVVDALRTRQEDSSALVREHVEWALARHAA